MKKRSLIIFVFFVLALVLPIFVDAKVEKLNKDHIEKEFNSGKKFVNVLIQENNSKNKISTFSMEEKNRIFSKNITYQEYLELSNDESVVIEYNFKIKKLLQQSTKIIEANNSWILNSIGVNLTGRGQTVCILDTGVNYSHPDFGSCTSVGSGGSCRVLGGYDFGDNDANPMDVDGHGTHVAGIVGANGGITGVAPNASIVAIKVFSDTGLGSEQEIIDGLDWCIDNASLYNITVISMSLGLVDDFGSSIVYDHYCDNEGFTSIRNKINFAVAQNISVVVASGNDGSAYEIGVPACIQNATPISSTNDADTNISSFANTWNNTLLKILAAPGESINSTMLLNPYDYPGSQDLYAECGVGHSYCSISGTSMATPHVAGAIAILRQYLDSIQQTRTPDQIEDLLNSTGKQIYDIYAQRFFSRIDVYSALMELDATTPNVTLFSPIDSSISTNQNQTFICNTSDWQLANVTFYLWNSTSLYYKETKNVTGTSNSSSFNITNIPAGNYEWNCLASDVNENLAFSASNFSFSTKKQLILIGIDGFQYNHYITMLNAGNLSNFTRLMANGGWNGTLNITGHTRTETAPGNAELHTGLNETLNGIYSNSQNIPVPKNTTEYERIKAHNTQIRTGSIYGKYTTYLNALIQNAVGDIDWLQNTTSYNNSGWLESTSYTNSINVSNKTKEFISAYMNESFYILVYFGVPDKAGHYATDNSAEYNDSFINVDSGLGILLDSIEENNLTDVKIIITADHGWNEGTTSHSNANADTLVLPLITNDASLVAEDTSDGVREQCDVVPTILDYFGASEEEYEDILENGCESMLLDEETPLINNVYNEPSINEVEISWSTNEQTNYSFTLQEKYNTSFSIDHALKIFGLSASTNYNYNLTYCDRAGNCNLTEQSFRTSDLPITRSSSGGGGATQTKITESQLEQGYNKKYSVGEKVPFVSKGQNHSIQLNKILNETVNITIRSEPINLIMQEGEGKKLNLTSPEYYDLYIKIENVTKYNANITIKSIEELINPHKIIKYENETQNETNDEKEDTFENTNEPIKRDLAPLYATLALLICAFFYFLLRGWLAGKKGENKNKKE